VRRLDHVLLKIRVEAVLRPENRADLDAAGRRPIHNVPERGVYGRGIAHKADRSPLKELTIEEDIGTENNRHGYGRNWISPSTSS
jgi:hypothetical protein